MENKSYEHGDSSSSIKITTRSMTRRYTYAEKGKAKVDDFDICKELEEPGERDVKGSIGAIALENRSKSLIRPFQLAVFSGKGSGAIWGLRYHPDYPYLTLLQLGPPSEFKKDAYCFLFYLLDVYKMAFIFDVVKLKKVLPKCMQNKRAYNWLGKFFALFKPLEAWLEDVHEHLEKNVPESGKWGTVILGRKFSGENGVGVHVADKINITCEWVNFSHENLRYELQDDEENFLTFKNMMMEANGLDVMENMDILLTNPYLTDLHPEHYKKQMDLAAKKMTDRLFRDTDLSSGTEYTTTESSDTDGSEEI